jgi:hypothetical protein
MLERPAVVAVAFCLRCYWKLEVATPEAAWFIVTQHEVTCDAGMPWEEEEEE